MSKKVKTALVTGSACRIGAQIIKTLHQYNYQVIIHYKTSQVQAKQLCAELNASRINSARYLYADLAQLDDIQQLAKQIDTLDLLVNNAASFYAKSLQNSTPTDWDTLINHNLRAGFFLIQALRKKLKSTQGNIVNIVDIYAQRPLKNYPIYNITKSGLAMMTKTLAKELAPDICVNGIAPGLILWPQNNGQNDKNSRQKILETIPLKKQGTPQDIAKAVYFLANADYITGQILAVDGGRTLNQ